MQDIFLIDIKMKQATSVVFAEFAMAQLEAAPFYALPQVYNEEKRLDMILETFKKYNSLLDFEAGF